MAQRKRYLFVCTNSRPPGTPKGSCTTRGAVEIHAALKAGLNRKGLTQTEVRACTSSCLDVCWAGPVIQIAPDGVFYGRVTLEDVDEIVEALGRGEHVARLLLPAADFEQKTAGMMLPELFLAPEAGKSDG